MRKLILFPDDIHAVIKMANEEVCNKWESLMQTNLYKERRETFTNGSSLFKRSKVV